MMAAKLLDLPKKNVNYVRTPVKVFGVESIQNCYIYE